MPQSRQYCTQELVDHLKSERSRIAAKMRERLTTHAVVCESADGSTFRAFVHYRKQPSIVYRAWALRRIEASEFEAEISSLRSQREFDSWHASFCGDLLRYWHRQMGEHRERDYAYSRKLINLLLESLVQWEGLPRARTDRLTGYLHIPLDRYTLRALRSCLDDFPEGKGVQVPAGATMGYVTPEIYEAMQAVARKIAKKARVPTIYIDKLAWDYQHQADAASDPVPAPPA